MVAKEEELGKGQLGSFGIDRYTLLYSKWVTNKDHPIAQGALLSVMWWPGWEGILGENGYMCVWLSPFTVHLKLLLLLLSPFSRVRLCATL